jgi:hypothetical protein
VLLFGAMVRFVLVVLLALPAWVGCPSEEQAPGSGKRMAGTDGRDRWIVVFDAKEPDLTEYRELQRDDPAEAEGYVQKMRAKLAHDRADFEAQVQALDGKIVERWWMSNALTVEVKPEGVPTLRSFPGVRSITPDVPLE